MHLTRPPSDHGPIDPVIVGVDRGAQFFRIYDPESHGATATSFRHFGPTLRFDHQTAPEDHPAIDPKRGITYIGETFLCCLGEVFGDEAVVVPGTRRVAHVVVSKRIRLLDLRKTAATGVGTTHAIGSEGIREITHAWARWFYEHSDLKGIDGLLYTAFHSGHDSIALFERASGKIAQPANGLDCELRDPMVRNDLLAAAKELHLIVDL